jgi:hypothetical protein
MSEERTLKEKKALVFLEHIEEHLDAENTAYQVICTICGQTVDRIWEEKQNA